MLYHKLVAVYEKLEKTTKRLEKTYIISEFLKTTSLDDIPIITLLLQGKLFPNWDERKIGVASRLVLKAINVATGINIEQIEKEWKKTGDLGVVAENLIRIKKQATLFSKSLTVRKVFDNLRKLAELEGAGTVEKKLSLIAELLTSAKPIEAKYIVRTILEVMRVGVGEGSLRDAIVWAFFSNKIGFSYDEKENIFDVKDREKYNEYVNAVQKAFDLTNDFSVVATTAKSKGLKGLLETELVVGRPVKVMLALKVDDIKEAFEKVEKPADIEFKYDGFRMQINKSNGKIKIFTRRLEDVTKQFPDVIYYIKNNIKGKEFILDSEAVGYDPKTKRYLPFQNISQRIKRKYGIEKMAKELPVELNIFDVLYYNGKNMIKEEFKKRRDLLEKIVSPVKMEIVLAKNIVTSSEKEAKKFYEQSLKAGNEGVMFKNIKAPYKPGARVGFMIKLKSEQEPMDLVIVGAEWGEGKRVKWLSSFTLACIDKNKNFLEIGKVGTGIKEKPGEGISFKQLTDELKPLITSEKGKYVKVKPEVVVEITYGEIQKSPNYSSGFALRFPRIKRLRTMERTPYDITTLGMVKDFYEGQKK